MIRSFAVAAVLTAVVVATAGCGGSDSPEQGTAAAGGPASSDATGLYQQTDIKNKMNNRAALPTCPTYLANEAICGFFFNYLLAWQPNATAGATPQLGYRNAARPADVEDMALVWLPKTGVDGSDAVAGPPTEWDPRGDDGAWHWGPGQCGGTKGNWRNCSGKSTAATFADKYQIEWTDEGANEANGSADLNLSAGEVDLGQTWVNMYNEGQEGGGRCRASNRTSWPAYVVCGDNGGHDAQMRCDHPGDVNDQCSYGFWFRNFPVRITVRNGLPQSRLEIESIAADNFKIAEASNLTAPSSVDVATADTYRYLVGFRRFNAADAGDDVIIRGVLRSTTETPDKWSGSGITMRARLGSERVGSGGSGTTTGERPQGSSCDIEKSAGETSIREPQCSVSTVVKGGPGELNDIQFYLR